MCTRRISISLSILVSFSFFLEPTRRLDLASHVLGDGNDYELSRRETYIARYFVVGGMLRTANSICSLDNTAEQDWTGMPADTSVYAGPADRMPFMEY